METFTPPVWKGNARQSRRLRSSPRLSKEVLRYEVRGTREAIRAGPRTSDFVPMLTDKYGRAITDLRISVTDRCNYKCVYCRTGNFGAQFPDLPMADYLRMARLFVSLGIEKIRITGGEPLLRKGVVEFVQELSKLRTTTPFRNSGSPPVIRILSIPSETNTRAIRR